MPGAWSVSRQSNLSEGHRSDGSYSCCSCVENGRVGLHSPHSWGAERLNRQSEKQKIKTEVGLLMRWSSVLYVLQCPLINEICSQSGFSFGFRRFSPDPPWNGVTWCPLVAAVKISYILKRNLYLEPLCNLDSFIVLKCCEIWNLWLLTTCFSDRQTCRPQALW